MPHQLNSFDRLLEDDDSRADHKQIPIHEFSVEVSGF